MKLSLPKTMTGLVAAGCLLAAAPLLVALLLAGSQLDRLTRHSETLVAEGLTVVRLGSQLRDNINDLERSTRQYIALQDPALLDVVDRRTTQARITLQLIDDRRLPALAAPVQRLRQGLATAAAEWSHGLQDPASLTAAADRIHTLGRDADAILTSGRDAIDAEIGHLRSAAGFARRLMLVCSLTVLPLTALLAFAFSVAVTRPLRILGRGIADLGHSRYEAPIAIGFPREITQLGERLDWLRRRLAQLEADKDRFLRHVSHELKTPLASLQEGSALLCEGALGPLSPRQAEVAQILRESAADLAGLIDNLLAYAKWRNEQTQPEMAWFDARELVDEVLSRQTLPLDTRQLRTELDLSAPRLFGHRMQLRVALENLLTNAIKHAPQGSAIAIDLAVRGGFCELAVRDQGKGVPAAEKLRIFEPFVRGAEAEESAIRGSGLGLSIVQEAVLAHHGTVEVEDAHPGTRFKLAWPCPAHVAAA